MGREASSASRKSSCATVTAAVDSRTCIILHFSIEAKVRTRGTHGSVEHDDALAQQPREDVECTFASALAISPPVNHQQHTQRRGRTYGLLHDHGHEIGRWLRPFVLCGERVERTVPRRTSGRTKGMRKGAGKGAGEQAQHDRVGSS